MFKSIGNVREHMFKSIETVRSHCLKPMPKLEDTIEAVRNQSQDQKKTNEKETRDRERGCFSPHNTPPQRGS